jgi:hypothetical protein
MASDEEDAREGKARMLRGWRRVGVMALAAGAALATPLAVIGPAQAAAAPVITIAAATHTKPVTHEHFVVYRGGALASAQIHGTITGAAARDVAALYAQQFPYKKPPVRLGSIRLKAAKLAYSFPVTPTLATRYVVRLFADSAFKIQLATSAVANLYVVAGGFFTGGSATCGRPVCHQTFHVFAIVPNSALHVEMKKHFFPYFGLNLGSVRVPPPPGTLVVFAGHAHTTPPGQINAGEFVRTVTFAFTVGGHSYAWAWLECTKDSESIDGLGLPGSHGCGTSQVPRTVAYLG